MMVRTRERDDSLTAPAAYEKKFRKVPAYGIMVPYAARPFMMAAMACSRTPYRMYRPVQSPSFVDGGWKSTAPFHLVKFEPVKSADPPTSSGMTSWIFVKTVSESFLEAMAGSLGLYVGRFFSHPSVRSPVSRRVRSACSFVN